MKLSTSLIGFTTVLPALSCSKSIQDAPVGSVDADFSLVRTPRALCQTATQQCGPNKGGCGNGCCSQHGWCGLSEAHCDSCCQSQCDSTHAPFAAPTSSPSAAPTSSPSAAPTSSPSAAPTSSPSAAPTSSPSAAPTRDMFDWGISAKKDDVVVFSDETMQQEVVLKYFLSNKVYNVTILAKNCSAIVPSNVISYVTTDDALGSKNNATVLIDINQSSVENSVVWSTPEDDLFLIDFCVRLDLWYGDISMNFLEREVSLKVNMTSQNFTFSAENLDTTEGEEVNEYVEAAYEVIACQCTDDGLCVSSQEDTSSLLSQGSSLYVCLRANTTDVIVDSVKELTIAQDGTLNAQVPIVNGVNQGAVAVKKLPDMQNEFLVRTQLISSFFEDDTNDLAVSGVAKLVFKSGRKLSAKIVDVRNLQAQDQDDLSSQFGLNINIQSGSNEDDFFSGGNVMDFILPFASVVIMGIVLPAISALVM